MKKIGMFFPWLLPCKSLVSLHTCVKLSPKPKLCLSQSIEKTLVLGHANIFLLKHWPHLSTLWGWNVLGVKFNLLRNHLKSTFLETRRKLIVVYLFQSHKVLQMSKLWFSRFLNLKKKILCKCKGQLISKCLFGIFNSPKKWTKKIIFTAMVTQVELFSFVFWENWRHQKDISKLTDV